MKNTILKYKNSIKILNLHNGHCCSVLSNNNNNWWPQGVFLNSNHRYPLLRTKDMDTDTLFCVCCPRYNDFV